MNQYIRQNDTVVEIGSGSGFATEFIDEHIILTEVVPHPWIDLCADGANLPFGIETIDVVICANVLHHLASPMKFLLDVHRCLKPGGHVLLIEPNPSLLLWLALRIMRHEGWSFDVNVFDPNAPVNDPEDPWSGNNAISYLMFRDRGVFQTNVDGFDVMHDSFAECAMLIMSGGVTAKTKSVELPMYMLNIIQFLDKKMCRWLPKIFAMIRFIVLRKQGV